MGVWACSCGTLRFGARLSQEVLDTLVNKLAADVENRYLERQDEGMFQHTFVLGGSDDEEENSRLLCPGPEDELLLLLPLDISIIWISSLCVELS